jgi:hypothetical protein
MKKRNFFKIKTLFSKERILWRQGNGARRQNRNSVPGIPGGGEYFTGNALTQKPPTYYIFFQKRHILNLKRSFPPLAARH